MSNWNSVFKTNIQHQAEIVKDILLDNDIEAVLLNKKDSSYHFGNMEVKVEQSNVIKALKIIGDLDFK
ncbi:putative signal transducing protein [Roseivirga echinicomitans]